MDQKKLWLAHCGDARAVLCKDGNVLQETKVLKRLQNVRTYLHHFKDHKPHVCQERLRVKKAGGSLITNGRVFAPNTIHMQGIAVARAIGTKKDTFRMLVNTHRQDLTH